METQVRTPQMVFMQPQRLIVPLFQRPYVWNLDNQWEPLWGDVTRTAERVLSEPHRRHHPHFLGAVVVQQIQNTTGSMQERTIIDGQQRLTTLQLLLDALHAELMAAGVEQPALRIETLITNAQAFWERPEDRFKVWPTNRDRPAFNAVMGAEPPVDHDALGFSGARLVDAHRYFSERAREWLNLEGPDHAQARGTALETSIRELVQMVVIDLTADENAQEIFETLNARGAQLTAADLIKNFVFQRLTERNVDVEAAYERYWKEFETGFWETEINFGRVRYPRSSAFLNQWLIARTGEEIVAREVFTRFKQFADFDAATPMENLLEQLHRAALVYGRIVSGAETLTGPIDRLALFAYRTSVLESEVIKPLLLFLLDPEESSVPDDQISKALDVVESWLVRRTLVRATSKSYTQVVSELITEIRKRDRSKSGDVLEDYLKNQSGANRFWPDDEEVRDELSTLTAYRRLARARLRMVLEAVEDYLRGWRDGETPLGEERAARGKLAIEHVMPRKWQTHWPLPAGMVDFERDQLIHTIGNLTLLTGRLNAKFSNGPWVVGADDKPSKRKGLQTHDVLMLNRHVLDDAGDSWTETSIRARTAWMTDIILKIWPVPEGHRSGFARDTKRTRGAKRVDLADLIGAGLLEPGQTLYVRMKKFSHRTATLLPDGQIDVEGATYSSPSGAAVAIRGRSTNGWWFFLVDPDSRRSLSDIWHEYVDNLAVDVDESDVPDEDGDDDS